jgi:hypothetical protein
MVFADQAVAEQFAFERTSPAAPTFGFHGIFNMMPLIGTERFWEIYQTLEDRSTAFTDYWLLLRQLASGKGAWSRQARLTIDMLANRFKRISNAARAGDSHIRLTNGRPRQRGANQ